MIVTISETTLRFGSAQTISQLAIKLIYFVSRKAFYQMARYNLNMQNML